MVDVHSEEQLAVAAGDDLLPGFDGYRFSSWGSDWVIMVQLIPLDRMVAILLLKSGMAPMLQNSSSIKFTFTGQDPPGFLLLTW